MKIVTASNGKKTIKMSKKEWEAIGKKAKWDQRVDSRNPISDKEMLENLKNEIYKS
jgi:hypothetical protein